MRGVALALVAAAGLIGNVRFRGYRDSGDVSDFSSLIGQQLRYRPTNKGGRRPAAKPARPRRTRAQKLRTQARRQRTSAV